MIKVINATNHNIKITNGPTFEPSGMRVYVETKKELFGRLNGIIMKKQGLGKVVGLPKQKQGVVYIVSSLVLEVGKREGRLDLIAPDIESARRNKSGSIDSVDGFVL